MGPQNDFGGPVWGSIWGPKWLPKWAQNGPKSSNQIHVSNSMKFFSFYKQNNFQMRKPYFGGLQAFLLVGF